VTGSALTVVHRDHIIALAARYKLPAVYYEDFYVAAGGLISYGTDNVDQFRRAAGYGGSASFSASGSWHSA
jgi:putative tryptophan/tyrosine transport system substrate-binding protein